MDWSGCDLVERVPGRRSGEPTIVGTRIPPEVIVGDYELGSPIEEIEENYPSLPRETIKNLIAFARSREDQSRENQSPQKQLVS
jgi:uncharacterized protein (DUF433 family)